MGAEGQSERSRHHPAALILTKGGGSLADHFPIASSRPSANSQFSLALRQSLAYPPATLEEPAIGDVDDRHPALGEQRDVTDGVLHEHHPEQRVACVERRIELSSIERWSARKIGSR